MSESLVRVKSAPELRLYVPGQGMLSVAESRAKRAVEEYDERLMLARHELTGDWCVFLQNGPFGEPYPVIGLGQDLPHPDDIKKRLYQADAVRRGEEILDQINRHNESIQQRIEDAASEGSGIAAEALEWGFRRMGSHPHPRIFVPS